MTTVLCHIVGMDDPAMNAFIDKIAHEYKDISVINLEKVTQQVNKNFDFDSHDKKNLHECIQINQNWKKKANASLNRKMKTLGTKSIILLGQSNHHKNLHLRMDLNTDNKFIYDSTDIVESIIGNNIDKYRNFIVSGKFPLKYLDFDFVQQRRQKLIMKYRKMDYVKKSSTTLDKWLNLKIFGHINKAVKNNFINLYVANDTLYDSEISSDMPNIKRYSGRMDKFFGEDNSGRTTAYKHKWMALLSAIPGINKYIKKGYAEYKNEIHPYIAEKTEGGFDKLKKDCYLYVVEKDTFDCDKYKYKAFSDDKIVIKEKEHIKNIYNELKKLKVKFQHYE
jgi:hypothetical protein